MPQATEFALTGRRILVTRPAEQAAQLERLIREAGGNAILFPAIEIAEPADTQTLLSLIEQLPDFDLAIFISPTAVSRAFRHIPLWPARLRAAAVGAASAEALRQAGVNDVLAPTQASDSEALLALPQMQQVSGKRIVIFRGEGGRELLADTLRQRGARVEYAECYRRAKPTADPAALLDAPFDAVIVTSSEGLNNLRQLLGPHWQKLCASLFCVPHQRIAEAARQAGVSQTLVSPGGDAALVAALAQHFHTPVRHG